MATKRKRINETQTGYQAKRKPATVKSSAATITLRWTEVEHASEPIVLKRNGEPIAVVVKYADYYKPNAGENDWSQAIADMAADPEIQNELRQIQEEFAVTEGDRLEGL